MSVEARFVWALSALLGAAACGGGEASPSPSGAGTGGTQSGAGTANGGASGSGAMPSGGRSSGAGGSSGTTTGADAGTGSATGGFGAGGGGRASGGTAGAVSAGAGGMSAGRSGVTGGAPTGESGAGGEDSSGGTGSQALSFEADIWPVFAMKRDPVFVYPGGTTYESCVTGGVCHGGPAPGAALKMTDAATAYGMLLDAPSNSELCAGTIRVAAGKPAESCLILFYEGRLRDELDWVDTAEIERARQWIAEGALP